MADIRQTAMDDRLNASGDARRWALIALGVFVVQEIVSSGLFVLRRQVTSWRDVPLVPLTAFVFFWIVPLLIVYLVEKRGASSLGLVVPRERYGRYALYAVAGLVVPAVFVGVDRSLLGELIEQIVYIGLAEEVFNRGYLLHRLCAWLGDHRGLWLGALLFSLSHIVSRVSQHGWRYPLNDLSVGLQTLLGGLLLGYMYLRAKNIVPPAIFHVSTNLYLGRMIALLSS